MFTFRPFTTFSALLAGSLILSGCFKTKVTPEEETAPAPAAEAPAQPAAPAPEAGAPALEGGAEFAGAPAFPAAHFGYMKADLDAEARAGLKKNAAALKAVLASAPSVQIRVEGHCDERGTLEYNLALGQRRANSVEKYYLSLGIAKAAMKTISYGQEHPVCSSSTEACWAENRRGETTLRSDSPVRIPLSDLPAN